MKIYVDSNKTDMVDLINCALLCAFSDGGDGWSTIYSNHWKEMADQYSQKLVDGWFRIKYIKGA